MEFRSPGVPTHATVKFLAMWDLAGLGRRALGSLRILNSKLAFLIIIKGVCVYVFVCVCVCICVNMSR